MHFEHFASDLKTLWPSNSNVARNVSCVRRGAKYFQKNYSILLVQTIQWLKQRFFEQERSVGGSIFSKWRQLMEWKAKNKTWIARIIYFWFYFLLSPRRVWTLWTSWLPHYLLISFFMFSRTLHSVICISIKDPFGLPPTITKLLLNEEISIFLLLQFI